MLAPENRVTRRRVFQFVLASIFAIFLACIASSRLRSPESAAEENTYAVWIALLKGFSGDVMYIGSTDSHAYFRAGQIFWSFYKIPACVADLPATFAIGKGEPYLVSLKNLRGQSGDCSLYKSSVAP